MPPLVRAGGGEGSEGGEGEKADRQQDTHIKPRRQTDKPSQKPKADVAARRRGKSESFSPWAWQSPKAFNSGPTSSQERQDEQRAHHWQARLPGLADGDGDEDDSEDMTQDGDDDEDSSEESTRDGDDYENNSKESTGESGSAYV